MSRINRIAPLLSEGRRPLVAVGTAGLADPHLPERIVRDLERNDG